MKPCRMASSTRTGRRRSPVFIANLLSEASHGPVNEASRGPGADAEGSGDVDFPGSRDEHP